MTTVEDLEDENGLYFPDVNPERFQKACADLFGEKSPATTLDTKTTPLTCDMCGRVITPGESIAQPTKPGGGLATVHLRCMEMR